MTFSNCSSSDGRFRTSLNAKGSIIISRSKSSRVAENPLGDPLGYVMFSCCLFRLPSKTPEMTLTA